MAAGGGAEAERGDPLDAAMASAAVEDGPASSGGGGGGGVARSCAVTSGLDPMDDEHMITESPCYPESRQPHPESVSDPVDWESKSCSTPLMDEEPSSEPMDLKQSMDVFDLSDGEMKPQAEPLSIEQPISNEAIYLGGMGTAQHSSPLSPKEQNSNNCAGPFDKDDKQLSLSFPHGKQPQSVGAGLRNMGNTCFLNATLQCITHTVPLILQLRLTDHPTPCSYDKDGFCSFCALKEHIDESIQRSGSVLRPARFRDNLNKLSRDFRPGQQEDAHEFLRYFLDNLHKCTIDPKSKSNLSSFDEESVVKQVFGGRLKGQLTCCECGHCSESSEPFLDLSLEIDQVDDLVDALESFTKVERLGDTDNKLTCEHCNAQVCKDKQLMLDSAPDVIAFQLKRFSTIDNSIEKIDKHVAYPSELDLKPFHNNPDGKKELKYDLYGIVEHSGLANYGHYVCTIRSSPSTWYLMNDSCVDSITEISALSQEAYILFYVRQGVFPWFSNVLEEALHVESTSGASPVSVLENINADCLMSSGEGSSGSFKLEKDGTSQCKASLLCEEPAEKCPGDSLNLPNVKDDMTTCRASSHVAMGSCRNVEIANLEKPSTPPPYRKRSFSEDDYSVFDFEYFDDDEKKTPLMPASEHQTKAKKAKAASISKSKTDLGLDKNATRLMRSMPSQRRKGLMDCLMTQHAEEARSCPRSDPLGKKKRKLAIPVLQYG